MCKWIVVLGFVDGVDNGEDLGLGVYDLKKQERKRTFCLGLVYIFEEAETPAEGADNI